MLKNRFRKLVGVLILLVFGVAVIRFVQQTGHNPYVGGAVATGLKLFLSLGLILGLIFLFDRRVNRGKP